MGDTRAAGTRHPDDAVLIARVQAEIEHPDYQPPRLASCSETAAWLGVGLRRVMNYGYRYPAVRHGDLYDVRAVAMHFLRTERRRRV